MKLLAATLVALTLATAPVQAKETYPEHRQLFDALKAKGVSVVMYDKCPSNILGLYYPSKAAIVLCTNTVQGEQIMSVLTHEAVHVAQDCLVGRVGDGLTNSIGATIMHRQGRQQMESFAEKVMGPLLSPNISRHVQSNEPKSRWAIELEAYAFEKYPVIVTKLLSFCN